MSTKTKQSLAGKAIAITWLLTVFLFGVACRKPSNQQEQITYLDTTKLELPKELGALPMRIALARVESFGLLPDSVKTRIGNKMADPGRAFNAGDVSIPGIPDRRLIFAAVSKPYYLVHYETGGEAHGFVVVLFQVADAGATPLWAHGGIKFADPKEFEREISTHTLKNEALEIFRQ